VVAGGGDVQHLDILVTGEGFRVAAVVRHHHRPRPDKGETAFLHSVFVPTEEQGIVVEEGHLHEGVGIATIRGHDRR